MTAAYVDSSVVTAIAFAEESHRQLAQRLAQFDSLFAAPLLEAEVRSAANREQSSVDEGWFAALTWVLPERGLRVEIIQALEAGYSRGADCWHLAAALHLAPDPAQLTFLTLDLHQREIATALGFPT
jgi:uncharacterized protein with PIN domain